MHPLLQRVQEALQRHHDHHDCDRGHHPDRHHHRGHDCNFSGHRGFPGFGGRSGIPGDSRGAGFDGLHRGRKLGSADLQLLLLALLAERPSHGYELIKALDERSNGYYAPSPGMVYPALTYLEEIGCASVEAQGARKLYRITEVGLTHLEGQRASVDALLEQLVHIGKRMDQMRRAMGGGDAVDDATDFDSPHAFRGRSHHSASAPEVRAARRSLKSALIEKSGAAVAEQRRIAEILERAAAEIRGSATKP